MKFKKLASLVVIGMLSLSTVGCFDEQEEKQDVENEDTKINQGVSNIDYQVASIDNMEEDGIVQETINIVVESEDYNSGQLYQIAQTEVLKYTEDNDVNSITVEFYTDKEHIHKGHDLGEVIYAPNGKLEDADKVKAGDYTNFKFVDNLKIVKPSN